MEGDGAADEGMQAKRRKSVPVLGLNAPGTTPGESLGRFGYEATDVKKDDLHAQALAEGNGDRSGRGDGGGGRTDGYKRGSHVKMPRIKDIRCGEPLSLI